MKTVRLIQAVCILVLALANFQGQLLIRRQRALIEEQRHLIEKSLAIANSCVGKQSRIAYHPARAAATVTPGLVERTPLFSK